MAISYPLSLPGVEVADISFRAVNAVSYSASPFTFAGQAHAYPGQMWQADISLSPMSRDDAEVWVSFLLSLRGQFGTFLMGDPVGASPRGSAGGDPVVNGGGQAGGALIIDGATGSQPGWAMAGDYVQIGAGSGATLHKVLVDADSDVAGNVTVDLWPHVRTAPDDNAPIFLTNTVGRWRLASNQSEWSINTARFYGIQFSAMEAI